MKLWTMLSAIATSARAMRAVVQIRAGHMTSDPYSPSAPAVPKRKPMERIGPPAGR